MSTNEEQLEKALNRACKWLSDWNEEYKLSPFSSADTFKHFFMDEEFQERFDALWKQEQRKCPE
jgi:hypothetical protein